MKWKDEGASGEGEIMTCSKKRNELVKSTFIACCRELTGGPMTYRLVATGTYLVFSVNLVSPRRLKPLGIGMKQGSDVTMKSWGYDKE